MKETRQAMDLGEKGGGEELGESRDRRNWYWDIVDERINKKKKGNKGYSNIYLISHHETLF